MRRLPPIAAVLAVALILGSVAGSLAGDSEPPDPNLGDTIYGTVDGLRYASDSEPFDSTNSNYANAVAGCGSSAHRLIGGGAAAGGSAANAWQSFARPFDYTDADIELDDGFLSAGYGPVGKSIRSYSICISGAQLDYRRSDVPAQPSSERGGSLECAGAGWHVVSGSATVSTTGSWLVSTFPIDNNDAGTVRDDGWRTTAHDAVGGLGGFKVYAVCATNVSRRYVKGSPSTVAVGAASKRKVSCGADHVVGGGVKVSGDPDKARLVVSSPYDGGDADGIPDDGWRTKVYNVAGSSKQVTTFAVCLES
jgi:hypothetical protein